MEPKSNQVYLSLQSESNIFVMHSRIDIDQIAVAFFAALIAAYILCFLHLIYSAGFHWFTVFTSLFFSIFSVLIALVVMFFWVLPFHFIFVKTGLTHWISYALISIPPCIGLDYMFRYSDKPYNIEVEDIAFFIISFGLPITLLFRYVVFYNKQTEQAKSN